MERNNLLSIILLSYYSEQKLVTAFEKIDKLLTNEKIKYELIIMDDGSEDKSFKIATNLEKANPIKIKSFQLSKNYTSNYSIFAGFSVATGGCVVAIPDDEQQPYSTLIEMYRLWEKGQKVIVPHRISRDENFIKRFFSNSFYKIMNTISDVPYPPGGADIVFVDREIVDIINSKIHPINTSIVTEVLRLGFSPYFLSFKRPRGVQEKSRWSFKKKVKLAKDIFFSSSIFPIKFITNIGLFFSLTAFLLIIFYTYINVFGNNEFWGEMIPGWTSIILFIIFFSGLILLSLGIIAQYIWLIYEEVKNRPGYIIKKQKKDK